MRKLLFSVSVSAVALAGGLFAASIATPALAAPDLNWGTNVNASQCDTRGAPVINVTQRVINTVDSGEDGNYWAFDNFMRQIQVWAQSNGTYCVVVRYEGKFDAQAGQQGPGPGGPVLDGDEDGTFEGGYRATVTGTLKASPAWKTRGFVGTTDYQCTISASCPGTIDWLGQYFEPAYSFEYEWWGWIYRAETHGTWVNSSVGNSGDIQ